MTSTDKTALPFQIITDQVEEAICHKCDWLQQTVEALS